MARRPTRADETRSADERYSVDEFKTSPLHIDPNEIPPDMEYRWVRMSVRGMEDQDNVRARTRTGWTPVPADRHPSYSGGVLFPGMTSRIDDSNLIVSRDSVLCEKPKRILKREREALARENLEIMQSTPGLENMPGGYVRENRSSVSHGFQGD
jgi:hypothetical protein